MLRGLSMRYVLLGCLLLVGRAGARLAAAIQSTGVPEAICWCDCPNRGTSIVPPRLINWGMQPQEGKPQRPGKSSTGFSSTRTEEVHSTIGFDVKRKRGGE
jgi:hypothetical protein